MNGSSVGVLFAACALAAGSFSSLAQGNGPASAAAGSADAVTAGQRAATPHRLVVVPTAISMAADFANGCWVRFHDGKDYKGEELMLAGPLQLASMGTTSPWWRRWNSLVVGPHARVTLYSKANYKGRSTELQALQRSSDLGGKELGWAWKIESTRVDCL